MLRYRRFLVLLTFFFSSSFIVTIGQSLNVSDVSQPSIVTQSPLLQTQPIINAAVGSTTNTVDTLKNTLLKTDVNTSNSAPHIFVYHSHNRESWIPELKNVQTADQAFDSKTNVTLLGKSLQSQLLSSNIPVLLSSKDYPTIIESFNYAKSYAYSKSTIKQELKLHKNIKYLLDLHRDSQKREKTTVQYKSTNYAQVYFVVGTKNSNWQQNMKFAKRIQAGLNAKVPNLSKGIYQKDEASGNGEYNQSLSGNSALIEIGGVENSLEESYRTIRVLAEVIQTIWQEDTTWKNEPTSDRSTA